MADEVDLETGTETEETDDDEIVEIDPGYIIWDPASQITVDGVEYTPISQEAYDELTAALETNRRVRYGDVEAFRVWCEANKGVSTVEEGLRACTAKELYDYYNANTSARLSPVADMISRLYARLTERETRRDTELAQAAVTPILPPEETDTDEEVGTG